MNHHVYVLFSVKFNKIYIGYSTNVEGRLASHNEFATKGWTIRFRPWTLVHQESFGSKHEGLMREKQLKSARGREWIRENILGQFYGKGYP